MAFQRSFVYDMGFWSPSGSGWALWQNLPYLSDEEVSASSRTKDVNSYHIITDLSYSGGAVGFTSARLSELATLEFENVRGDTESNGTGAVKAVQVPFHDGVYDFYRPKPITVQAYTQAYIDANDVLHAVKEDVTFILRTRSWNAGVGDSSFSVAFADVGAPVYGSVPSASAFEPWTDSDGVSHVPLFGAVNADALAYNDYVNVGWAWRITGFPSGAQYVPQAQRKRNNDFVMYGEAFAIPFQSYLTPAYVKAYLQSNTSTTNFRAYNKLVYS